MHGRSGVRAWRGLYAIVDTDACARQNRDAMDVARAVLRGGAAVVQLRAKGMEDAARERLALDLRALCSAAGVPLVVNDLPDLARRVGADGVHLGQGDMRVSDARAVVGDEVAIGISTHDIEQALLAERAGADLVGFGPVFPTRTKDNPDPVVGLAGLTEVCRRVAIPVVAIGGIEIARAGEVRAAGAPLAAAIGAVCGADDPESAARALHRALSRPSAGG
jgi:thiamine-phosphate diphosphorylase